MVSFQKYVMASQAALACEQARLAADYAARAGDDGLKARALAWKLIMLTAGTADDRAIARAVDELEATNPGEYLEAFMDSARCEVCRLRGEFDDAMRLANQASGRLEGLGMRAVAAATGQGAALVGISAGRYAQAVEVLLRSDTTLAELGERGWRSTIQAYLAWIYSMIPEPAAAVAACDLCDELTSPQDVINFAMTARARAQIARGDGNFELAEEHARLAVHHALRTDNLILHAAMKLELARVLLAQGRNDEARSEAQATLALYEARGDRPGVASARELLDELERDP
jgi:ATP/maltotriose-dependent transcriptional regulator MalT